MSFLFVFQNDNDLIDNDNAGQSPAAQAVVLTFSLTYLIILIRSFRFIFSLYRVTLRFTNTIVHVFRRSLQGGSSKRLNENLKQKRFNRRCIQKESNGENFAANDLPFLYIITLIIRSFYISIAISCRDTVAYRVPYPLYILQSILDRSISIVDKSIILLFLLFVFFFFFSSFTNRRLYLCPFLNLVRFFLCIDTDPRYRRVHTL